MANWASKKMRGISKIAIEISDYNASLEQRIDPNEKEERLFKAKRLYKEATRLGIGPSIPIEKLNKMDQSVLSQFVKSLSVRIHQKLKS